MKEKNMAGVTVAEKGEKLVVKNKFCEITIDLTIALSGIVIILIGFLVISATKFKLAHIQPKDNEKA